MVPLIILSTLFGAVLGLRLKVLVLVPAIIVVATVTLVVGIAQGESVWSFLLSSGLTVTVLQMGYLGGTVIRFVIAGTRVPKRFPKSKAAIQGSAR